MTKKLAEMSLTELWELFPVILCPYQEEYAEWFADEYSQLTANLGEHLVRLRHIGSTAVPGLLSKPTVDMLLEIAPGTPLPELAAALSACGYGAMNYTPPPELRWAWNKGYTENGFAERVFHLHVRYPGDWDEPYFCEYLRRHPEVAASYAALKFDLARRFKHDRDAYTAAKHDFVRRHTAAARAEMRIIR